MVTVFVRNFLREVGFLRKTTIFQKVKIICNESVFTFLLLNSIKSPVRVVGIINTWIFQLIQGANTPSLHLKTGVTEGEKLGT